MITYESYYNNNYIEPQVKVALEQIKDEIIVKKNNQLFYEYLIKLAPTEEEKEIIISIRDDESIHNALFKKIYKDFTGEYIDVQPKFEFQPPKDYITGIRQAIFDELSTVERYREIRKGMPSKTYTDMLFDIISDELKHSAKYNYIYTLNIQSYNNRILDKISERNHEEKKFSVDELEKLIQPLLQDSDEETKGTLLISALVGANYTIEEANTRVKERNEKQKKMKNAEFRSENEVIEEKENTTKSNIGPLRKSD